MSQTLIVWTNIRRLEPSMTSSRLIRMTTIVASLLSLFALSSKQCLAQIIAAPGSTVVVLPLPSDANSDSSGLIVAAPSSTVVVQAKPSGNNAQPTPKPSANPTAWVLWRKDYTALQANQQPLDPTNEATWETVKLIGFDGSLTVNSKDDYLKLANVVALYFDECDDAPKNTQGGTVAAITYQDDGKIYETRQDLAATFKSGIKYQVKGRIANLPLLKVKAIIFVKLQEPTPPATPKPPATSCRNVQAAPYLADNKVRPALGRPEIVLGSPLAVPAAATIASRSR